MAPLIKLRYPKPLIQGMVAGSMGDDPKAPPPWIAPHCWQCRIPVERFTIGGFESPWSLPIEWQCCGRTGAYRIPIAEVLYKQKHGGAIWVNTETRLPRGQRR